MIDTNRVYNENCIDTMKRMDNETIDLVVTSPPYDGLRTYNGYTFDFETIARDLFRVVKTGGVIVWIVNDQIIEGSESGTSFRQALYFKELGFKLHDTMIWNKLSARYPGHKQYLNCFEYMFVLSKSDYPKTANLMIDRPNKTAGRKGRSHSRKVDGEIVKSEVFVRRDEGIRFNIWDLYPTPHECPEHPAPFPLQLAMDHVVTWSNEGDLVYDPFMGSGTTALACIARNRKFIGSELSKEYCDLIDKRISGKVGWMEFLNG